MNKILCFLMFVAVAIAPIAAQSQGTAVAPPYNTGFETGNDVSWNFANSTNGWYIGNATNNGGGRSLYISNDGGVSNAYTTSDATSSSYAYKPFILAATEYTFEFDWKAYGEGNYDYLRVFIAPASATFTAGNNNGISASGAPSGWTALDGGSKLNSSNSWQHVQSLFTPSTAGTYYLVFYWYNDSNIGTQSPAAIDNVSVVAGGGGGQTTCGQPVAIPYSEGFEGGEMPVCWTQEGSGTWMVGTGDYYTSTGTHAGSYNALIKHSSTNNVTKLISPTFNLSTATAPQLTFWFINRAWVGDTDELRVYYRTSSTGTWQQVFATTEGHDTWTEATVSLPNTAIQIAFEMTDNYGYGVAIDDIYIGGGTPSTCLKSVPYNEGFEGVSGVSYFNSTNLSTFTDMLPDCWTATSNSDEIDGTTYFYQPHVMTNAHQSGSNSLGMSSAVSSSVFAFLPQMGMPLNQLQLSFWMKTSMDAGTLMVGYVMGDDETSFTPLESVAASNSAGQTYTVNYNNVPPTAKHIAFKWLHNVTNAHSICYIDDISVTQSPNGSGCVALSIPYSEDFESYDASTYLGSVSPMPMPDCWYQFTPNSTYTISRPHVYTANSGDFGSPHSGANNLMMVSSYGIGDTSSSYVVMPETAVPLNQLQLDFWLTSSSSANSGVFTVGYVTGDDYTTFNPVEVYYPGYPSVYTDGGVEIFLNLTSLPANAKRLAFKWEEVSSWGCWIDDVHLDMAPACNPVAVTSTNPFYEGFEGGVIPSCWTQGGGWIWNVGEGDYGSGVSAHTGNYNVKVMSNASTVTSTLTTPLLDLTGLTNAQLSFWHLQRDWYGDIDELTVYYRTSPNSAWTQLAYYSGPVENWAQEVILLPNPSSTYQLAFEAGANEGYGVAIDDVTIGEASSCLPVNDLVANDLTATSVTLSWTDASNSNATYTIFNMADNSTVATVTGTSYTIAGLNTATTYNFGVRTNCSGEEVSFIREISFRTPCSAVAVPYIENFESDGLYDCWTLCHANSLTGRTANGVWGATVLNGTCCFAFAYNTDPPQYLISPELAGTGNGLEVSLSYVARNGSYPESFVLGYSTTTNDTNAFVWGTEVTNITNQTYERYVENMLASGIKYVAVKYTAYDQFYLYIDSLVVRALSDVPLCTQNIPYYEGFESYDAVDYFGSSLEYLPPLPTCWDGTITSDICIDPSCSGYPINYRPHVVTNTTGARALCWSGGTQSLEMVAAAHSSTYALLPPMNTSLNQLQLMFWMGTNYYATGASALTVGYVTSDDASTFVPLQSYPATEATLAGFLSNSYNPQGKNIMVTLSNVPASATRLAFKWENNADVPQVKEHYPLCFIDDISITPLNSTNILYMTSCEDYYWNQTGMIYNTTGVYKAGDILYLTINHAVGKDTTVCIPNGTFTWHGVEYAASGDFTYFGYDDVTGCDLTDTLHLTIGTCCTPKALPYFTSFEEVTGVTYTGSTNPDYPMPMPECWLVATSAPASAMVSVPHVMVANTGGAVLWKSGVNSLAMCQNGDNYAYALLPEIIVPLNNLRLQFWMGTLSPYGGTLTVGYVTNDDYSTFTALHDYPSSTGTLAYMVSLTEPSVGGSDVVLDLTNVPYEATRLAFRWNSSFSCFIDDISVDFPNIYDCLPAQDIQATDVQTHQVTLRWYDPNGGASYTVSHEGNVDATGLTADADGFVTCTINNLSQATSYTFKVQATCSTGYLSNFASIVVTTSQCEVLTNLQTVAHSTSVQLSWEDPNGGTSYSVMQFTDDPNNYIVELASGIYAGADGHATFTIPNLISGTDYFFAVAGSCVNNWIDTFAVFVTTDTNLCVFAVPYTENFETDGDYDCWTVYVTSPYTGLFEDANEALNGTTCFRFFYSTNPPQCLISPELTGTDNGLRLGFSYKVHDSNFPESFMVGYSTTTNDISAFVWSTEMTNLTNETYERYDEDMLANGIKYVAVKYTAYNQFALCIDSLAIREIPDCSPVSNITVSDVTSNSVTLSWTDAQNGDATYTIYNSADNSIVATGITATNHTITGLTVNTAYTFSVIANCSATESSAPMSINATTDSARCDILLNLGVQDVWSDQADIHWTDPTNGSIAYTLLQLTSDPTHPYQVIAAGLHADATGMVSYTIPNLVPGQSYTFAVAGACTRNMVDTIEIVITTESSPVHNESACHVPYEWHGVEYLMSGEYYSRNDTLYLEVLYGDTATIACESFDWYEHVGVIASGDYTHVFTASTGCDSVVTLHLTVNHSTVGDTTAVVCNSFDWYEHVGLTTSGNYTHTFTTSSGCDSMVTLHLTVNYSTVGDTTAVVCNSFDWYEHVGLTTSGNFTHTFTTATGCDSVVTLHLTVNHSTVGDTTAVVCNSFDWYEHVGLTTSGNYTHTFTTATGCDSVVTLHLTVNNSTVGDTTAVVCNSFDWYEHVNLTTSGNYTHTFTTATGCDSVVTLHLTVNHSTVGDTTAVVCNSFDWYEHVGLTTSGNYTHTFTTATGCDSVVTLHLTVNTCCSPVENLAVDSVSTTTVSLSWTGIAASYTVMNGNTEVATGITETHYTVPGLTPATNYIFSVIANCSATESSDPVSVNATTDNIMIALTVLPNDPTMSMLVLGSGSYPLGDTAILAAVANNGFYFVNWEADNTVLGNDNPLYLPVTIGMPDTIYAIFDTTSCEPVINLTVVDTTLTSVTLAWEDPYNSGATYAVGYSDGTSIVIVDTGISATTYTIDSLMPNTTYYFVVRTDCAPSVYVYSDVVIVTMPTSIASYDGTSDWKLYPNPASTTVTIEAEGMRSVTIFDATGREVEHRSVNSDMERFDMTKFGNGVYFFRIEGIDRVTVRKCVVSH